MELTLKEHHFDEKYPVQLLDFLARFVREESVQMTSEEQVIIDLP